MEENDLKKLLNNVKNGAISIDDALLKLKEAPYEDIGFAKLDTYTSGFQNSELIIIGARPSIGKTALALSIIQNIACEKRIPCGFFSLEMPYESIGMRLLAQEARVPMQKIRSGMLKIEDVKNAEPSGSKHTIDELYDLMLSIVGKLEGWDKEEYKSEEIKEEEPIENSTQEQRQQESTGDKVLQEDFIKKDVVKPIANAIKKKILNSNGDMIAFKSRRDRIKESNKKFFNNN